VAGSLGDRAGMTGSRPAVCSWSLQPGDVQSLVGAIMDTGLTSVQLALDPIRLGRMEIGDLKRRFAAERITLLSGMMAMEAEDYSTLESIRATGGIVPDATWPENRRAAAENARIASDLGIRLVTFHAGFVPEEGSAGRRAIIAERLRLIAGRFGEHGIRVALETGQESADTLLLLLAGLPGIGVNFDPANMILYGMGDPVKALERLGPHVMQVHVKDAIRSAEPGRWGTEVPVGEGDVDWASFFSTLRSLGPDIGIAIERESGDDRVADIRTAATVIARYTGSPND